MTRDSMVRFPLNRRQLRKLRGLTWLEWRDLIRAQLTLIYVHVLIRLLPRGKLVGKSQQTAAAKTNATSPLPPRVRQLERCLYRAAQYGLLRSNCLVRAIALQRIIQARGYPGSRVRVGVRWDGKQFLAHAWVEYLGHILGDDSIRVASFDRITPLELRNG